MIPRQTKSLCLYTLSITFGAVIWISISIIFGEEETWDSKYYFFYGLPLMMLVSFLLGYIEPIRPWRWGAAVVAAQALLLLLKSIFANLLPLGLIIFGLISMPCIAAAYFGSFIKRSVGMGSNLDY